MQLTDRPLRFSKILHHAIDLMSWIYWRQCMVLGVAKPSIVDLADIEDAVGAEIVQSHRGHFYVPPVDVVQTFRISGPKFVELNPGVWDIGALYTCDTMNFYNLDVNNTNENDPHTLLGNISSNGFKLLQPKQFKFTMKDQMGDNHAV